jgi:hypothetical protein
MADVSLKFWFLVIKKDVDHYQMVSCCLYSGQISQNILLIFYMPIPFSIENSIRNK